jgi:tetratricopeptide (TPR) repeat protein
MLLHEDLRHGASPLRSPLLPPTVQAVVASRIDHLDEPARELVRRASVFARSTFSQDELALVAEPSRELLEMLEDEELLVRDPDRPDTWRFRHELLRAVAYESLPKRERLRLHLQVAEGLATEDRHPQVVAYHLEQAAKAALDLQPADRTVAERAVDALRSAGHQARRRMESRAAIDLYQRALAMAGPRERWGEREAEILAEIGEAKYWLGEFDDAADALNQALELGGEDPWTRAYAYRFLGDITLNAKADSETASELFDRALAAAREVDDRYGLARTLLMAGWAPYWRGNLDGARAMFEEALDVARQNPKGDRWAVARSLTSLTSVVSPVGDEREALALGQEALEIGRAMRDPFTIGVASENVGNSFRRMWRLDDAIQHLNESVRVFRELDARWELAAALGDRGNAYRLSGRLEEAEADLEWALELCRRLRERSLIAWTVGELALIRLLRGDGASARETLDVPDGTPTADDVSGSEVSLLRVRAVLHLTEGDADAGRQVALRALEVSRAERWPNPLAGAVWWTGTLFGAEAAGGDEAMEEARARLEAAAWLSNIREPEVLRDAVGELAGAVERVDG